MFDKAERDSIAQKFICHRCIGEAFLSNLVAASGNRQECDYCGRIESSWSIGDLASSVERVFDDHYVRTSDQPDGMQLSLAADRELNYSWERDGEPVLEALRIFRISDAALLRLPGRANRAASRSCG